MGRRGAAKFLAATRVFARSLARSRARDSRLVTDGPRIIHVRVVRSGCEAA